MDKQEPATPENPEADTLGAGETADDDSPEQDEVTPGEPETEQVAVEPSPSSATEIPPPATPTAPSEVLNPPRRALPESPALIPPHSTEPLLPPASADPLLPPSPVHPQGDVFRGEPEFQDYPDFRDGPTARPPRSRDTAPLPASEIEERPERTRPSRWSTIVLPLLAGAIGAGLVVGGFFLFRDSDEAPVATPAASAAPTIIRETVRTEFIGPEGSVADPTAVARKVIPSVVTVEVGVSDGDGSFNGTGSGSGVVLSEDGYIVTNEHVVAGSDVVTVSFSDGRLYQAELLGTDVLTDLAVLKIDATGLVAIDIGSTADLQIGDVAIAAGSPLGLEGGPTVTVGVLSAFNREVQTGPQATDRLLGMLQTDAPITRGSSGGALVDGQGALIGVTSAVGVSDVGVEGIGFAIPIEVVQRITDELIEKGEVTHSFLGIEGRTSFEDQSDGAEVAVGVFIQAVVDDSGADIAGIEEGDVIVSIQGTPVRTINSLVGQLRRFRVGEPLEIEITRAGDTFTLTVELGPRPDDV